MEEFLNNIEALIKELSDTHNLTALAEQYYNMFNEVISKIVMDANQGKYSFSYAFDITPNLELKLSDFKSGLWYKNEFATIPEEFRSLNCSPRSLARLFFLKDFIENLPKLTTLLDTKIKEHQAKRSELTKVFEAVKDVLDPLILSNQLSKK